MYLPCESKKITMTEIFSMSFEHATTLIFEDTDSRMAKKFYEWEWYGFTLDMRAWKHNNRIW